MNYTMMPVSVERRIADHARLAADIAGHMLTRSAAGPVAVIAENPTWLMPLICKEWHKLCALTRQERTRTFEAPVIVALTAELLRLHSCRFSPIYCRRGTAHSALTRTKICHAVCHVPAIAITIGGMAAAS